ncbi:hypothetical protein SCHPADRAFT_893746 [Schizopora paradoxa]|uniref:Uncharacterized protein n=1 Tax=Schizopora paradoxa TaxID=27342 RepID=A0A0H2R9V0_9AGAM|nr:hypothetical protein SCHPADRAFT_893746 [Schizopora paradoxa]
MKAPRLENIEESASNSVGSFQSFEVEAGQKWRWMEDDASVASVVDASFNVFAASSGQPQCIINGLKLEITWKTLLDSESREEVNMERGEAGASRPSFDLDQSLERRKCNYREAIQGDEYWCLLSKFEYDVGEKEKSKKPDRQHTDESEIRCITFRTPFPQEDCIELASNLARDPSRLKSGESETSRNIFDVRSSRRSRHKAVESKYESLKCAKLYENPDILNAIAMSKPLHPYIDTRMDADLPAALLKRRHESSSEIKSLLTVRWEELQDIHSV